MLPFLPVNQAIFVPEQVRTRANVTDMRPQGDAWT
jgi:hypothetical protein